MDAERLEELAATIRAVREVWRDVERELVELGDDEAALSAFQARAGLLCTHDRVGYLLTAERDAA